MDIKFQFNGSLKEHCIGLTKREIKEQFKENFIESTEHIYANNVFYKCAIDTVWGNDEDVCVDLWIDHELTEKFYSAFK